MKGRFRRGKKAFRKSVALSGRQTRIKNRYLAWRERRMSAAIKAFQCHVITRMGMAQIQMITAQPIPRFEPGGLGGGSPKHISPLIPQQDKALKIAQVAIDTAAAIQKVFSVWPHTS